MTRFHQVELGRERRSTVALDSLPGGQMDWEQPQLGRTGLDSLTLILDWHWEGGWTLHTGSRLSGSQTWSRHTYVALSGDEALELAQVVVAEALGLV